MKKNIRLIEVCSDLGAGTRGASFGFEALEQMAQQEIANPFRTISAKRCHIPVPNGYSSPFARNIETIYQTCHSIANEVHHSINNRHFPVLISGDHSCAAGTIAGIKMARPNARLGVVWIDAHADLHSPFTTPSGNMHGMPLAASINEDNKQCLRQEIDPFTLHFWTKLKTLGNITP
ncbi:MAG TPA: arginase family protein, partial [Bacteroidales bacterium]|nr:arginase family protein [Bacteroidales bacterium]